ncbi:leucyl aminopeptidase family protein [Phycicoccus sp. CSK15P-2]|uniref:leucyl aminopeptidase family protein n=1 Tax=Phycicoccus sp. CSK15P-2 TaxID=2807627 RepID=UPI0019504CAE|nr:leucyl aminopeptidase family protein [Phycicoccus sp. CSK15P-2]MBM6405132.1 leucyl aminopeptidase family protein [Phycicoccus sp. CSK15P-2]
MPHDVLLDPPLSAWSTAPSLDEALAGDGGERDLVVPLGDEVAVTAALEAAGTDAADLLETHAPDRSVASVCTVPLRPGSAAVRRVLLVGVGDGTAEAYRAAGAAVGRATRGRSAVVHALSAGSEATTAAWVEGAALGGWGSPRWTREGAVAAVRPAHSAVVVRADAEALVHRAVAESRAQLVARGLAMTPSNTKNPAWMAAQARTVARRAGFEVRVRDEKALRTEGFGGLLAVGSGSVTPPRLVELSHRPSAAAGAPHVVLVGKGITFDTGGLQVKPAEGMLGMKTDMSGSAVVLAVLAACAELEVPVRVTGLLALAENAVGGASYRPGDVVTQYGGTTVEIGNTDAEGRLVMADALAYADARLDPDVVVDIATLTGAARIALARAVAPVFATDDALAEALTRAGETTGETLWRMPLADTYRRALDSDVADLTHIATGVGGGAVTAALFLREFVGQRPWAHLDIAGTGRSDVDAGLTAKGATGFGTRLLLRWLEEMR